MSKPYQLILGNCLVKIPEHLSDNSVDSVVTDPPYELGFMGKTWDSSGIAYDVRVWKEALRVLKPGGYLLAFGGSRTYHRLACAIEDAGFEVRDQIMWVYGSGFPKSLDVSKAIDKTAGAKRVCTREGEIRRGGLGEDWDTGSSNTRPRFDLAATETAEKWRGWGTALKPAHEPIVVARKPLIGTVATNVLAYGTGAINIEGCRVGTEVVPSNQLEQWSGFGQVKNPAYTQTMNIGRWPANLIHDGSDEVLAAFPDAGGQQGGALNDGTASNNAVFGVLRNVTKIPAVRIESETSAARFFYCAKASRADRNEGCEEIDPQRLSHDGRTTLIDNAYQRNSSSSSSSSSNHHPTVKPTALMRYLCRLVTPPGGLVLDPFTGSGSAGKAALLEGFRFVGVELSPEYMAIAMKRLAHAFDPEAPEPVQKMDIPAVGITHTSLFGTNQENA